MDLGAKQPSPDITEVAPTSNKPKVTYPGFTLRDTIAESFMADNPCDMDTEFTATVKLRVTGMRKDQYGKSVDFDVLSLDNISSEAKAPEGLEQEEEEEEAEVPEEEILGFKRPAPKAPPVFEDEEEE